MELEIYNKNGENKENANRSDPKKIARNSKIDYAGNIEPGSEQYKKY
jgi:hypothetical protein